MCFTPVHYVEPETEDAFFGLLKDGQDQFVVNVY